MAGGLVEASAKRRLRLFIVTLVSAIVIAILTVLDLSPVSLAVATTLDAAVPGGVALLDELRAERRVSDEERAAELVSGTVNSDPWRLVAFVTLSLVAIERGTMIIFALVYAAWVVAVGGGESLFFDDVVLTTILYAFPVAVPTLVVASLLLARYVTHRVPTRPLVWVACALIGAVVIDVALLTIVSRILEAELDFGIAAKLYAILLLPQFVAACLGIRWAERDRGSYLMARLFKRLRSPDRAALVDLAGSVADPR